MIIICSIEWHKITVKVFGRKVEAKENVKGKGYAKDPNQGEGKGYGNDNQDYGDGSKKPRDMLEKAKAMAKDTVSHHGDGVRHQPLTTMVGTQITKAKQEAKVKSTEELPLLVNQIEISA